MCDACDKHNDQPNAVWEFFKTLFRIVKKTALWLAWIGGGQKPE